MSAPARAARRNTRKSFTTLEASTFVRFVTSAEKRKKGATVLRYLQIQTMSVMSKSNRTSDGRRIITKWRKHYRECPPSREVGDMFRLKADAEYYLKTFPAGTEIEFLGVVVSRLKTFPTTAAFRFPDGAVRFSTNEYIEKIK